MKTCRARICELVALAGQTVQVIEDLPGVLEAPLDRKNLVRLRSKLVGFELSYGDFAALIRRYSASKIKPDRRQVVEDLQVEA